MEPYAREGDFVFARELFPWENYSVGDIVIAQDPRDRRNLILKRIASFNNSEYIIEGDNVVASTDSRTFGAITKASIIGKVFWKI